MGSFREAMPGDSNARHFVGIGVAVTLSYVIAATLCRALKRTEAIGLTGQFHRARVRERAFGTRPMRFGPESRWHTDHADSGRSSHAVPFRTGKATAAKAHLAIGANVVRIREGFRSLTGGQRWSGVRARDRRNSAHAYVGTARQNRP